MTPATLVGFDGSQGHMMTRSMRRDRHTVPGSCCCVSVLELLAVSIAPLVCSAKGGMALKPVEKADGDIADGLLICQRT